MEAFLAASVEGRLDEAVRILHSEPGIAGRDLRAAAVLGDAGAVRAALEADPAAAVATDDERGWPPLLYACYSRWHQIEPARGEGLAEVVRLLLQAGASPSTNDGGRPRYRSALKGSVEVDNPAVAEVLLDAGADPDAGQPIGEAVGGKDQRCLRLLLAHGARVAGTWALGAAVFHDDPVAVSLMLEALDPTARAAAATEALPEAAADASPAVVEALLGAGADPDAVDGDGTSALRLAVRAGKDDTAARLRAAGAGGGATDVDHLLGACLAGDRPLAERLLAEHAGLLDRLQERDREAIVDAAASRAPGAVELMLELGFPPNAPKDGEYPLHAAAYRGNAAIVRLLLEAGAEIDARDGRFDATALAFATVGSGEQAGKPGDWVGTARLLLAAGASHDDVWVPEKPPSGELADLLRSLGITPGDPAGQPAAGGTEAPASGAMAGVAQRIETAYRERDLDLLGSLLHPEVTWTGLCQNRADVLDWYRRLETEGTLATVESVEVERDAVVLELSVSRPAEGARPAPPQKIVQVLTVEGDQIVSIRGYPDRAGALRRG